MSEKLESNIVDAVANVNFKTIGEFSTLHFISIMEDSRIATKQMNENLIRGSARMNGMLDTLTVRAGKDLVEPDPEEAGSAVKMWTGVDPLSQGFAYSNNQGLASANNILAATMAQILTKGAQSTPPISYPWPPVPTQDVK